MLPSVVSELEPGTPDAFRPVFHPISDMTSATDGSTMIGGTLRVEPVERTIPCALPFDRWDRVEGYRVMWEFFKREAQAS